MLYTRNAFLFRKFFKEKIARERNWLDLNFIASLHPDSNRRETGFAKLIYGYKDDLGKLLSTIALNVAADDQAIYELIQNADDCKSLFFSVSYDEKYLLCINNGNYFSNNDMSAIVNVAGNFKDGEDIGTFGIGFKILHRLVGEDDGRDAIINDYAGPIIFSWNKWWQFEKFFKGEDIAVGYDADKDSENPWLIKILYTCFPSHLGEKVRLKDYETQEARFEEDELNKMRSFLKASLQNLDLLNDNNLQSGSIFFLKLGKGKRKFLDDGIDKIKSGLSYSLKFLNSLKRIYINGQEIQEQKVSFYTKIYQIGSPEFLSINPKNKHRDIKFTLAFHRDYLKAKGLREEQVPNLYTFFSMDEERNGLNFLLHCNAFDMNNDRRKLQANSQINENLLPLIADEITKYIDEQKEKGRELFLTLYANLLLSKEIKSKPHINNYFFKYLKDYLHKNIPTHNGYANNPENVKIKNTALDINPSDFGCSEIEWFYWFGKSDKLLIDEACDPEKLAIKKWNVVKLLDHAVRHNKVDFINKWIALTQAKAYFSFIEEIDGEITKAYLDTISCIKLFKFSNGSFYSLNEIFENEDLILNYEKTSEIRFELQEIGFLSSYINIAEYPAIKGLIQNKFDDLVIYRRVAQKVKGNTLRKEQKHKLFFALAGFNNVDFENLKELELFKDTQGRLRPLKNLLKGDLNVPNWLFPFKIHIAEYIAELEIFLVKEKGIYEQIILPNWENVILNIANFREFYQKVKYYYDLDENNTALKKQAFVYLNSNEGFVTSNDIFFSTEFTQVSDYKDFQNAVYTLTCCRTPHKDILRYLKEDPFKVDSTDLFDYSINQGAILNTQEAKSILNFCKNNNELFFNNYVFEKRDNGLYVTAKSQNNFQVRPSKDVRKFINDNLVDSFKVLPLELDDYKDGPGIIQGEDLYNLIVESIDVNRFKEQLVDIISYDEPKRKFLLALHEVHLSLYEQYSKGSFEYKVLNLACHILRKEDYSEFRKKLIVETDGRWLNLSEIPPFTDKIQIDGRELSLARILPQTYQNSDCLSTLIKKFTDEGFSKDAINELLGIDQESDLSVVFELLARQTTTLDNATQLAYVILYHKFIEEIDLSIFKVETLGKVHDLREYSFYTRAFSFLLPDAILSDRYNGIEKILEDYPVVINANRNTYLLKEPFFCESEFVCPNLHEKMSDEQKRSFLDFVFVQWSTKSKKTVIRSINWSILNDIETKDILGFDPKFAVFPSIYSLESEELPGYLQEWLAEEEDRIDFLYGLGVLTEASTLVALRKFFLDQGSFKKSKLLADSRFTSDGTLLFNTFEWLKARNIELANPDAFDIFEEMVRLINTDRVSELEIQELNDFELLKTEAREWDTIYYRTWKETLGEKFTIYLYPGSLPKIIKLDDIPDYIFYRVNSGEIIIDDNNNIYINQNVDIKSALSSLIAEDSIFTTEDLLLLYQTKDTSHHEHDEITELRSEIERLRKRITELEGVSGRASYNPTVSFDEVYHDEIKEKSEAYLFDVLKNLFASEIVKWLNYDEETNTFKESWKQHDFEILDKHGYILHYIDCKGTPQKKKTFYLTSDEWTFFLDCVRSGNSYQIYRVINVKGSPGYIHIDNLWEWMKEGKVVPYLDATETIRGGRVFLTLK